MKEADIVKRKRKIQDATEKARNSFETYVHEQFINDEISDANENAYFGDKRLKLIISQDLASALYAQSRKDNKSRGESLAWKICTDELTFIQATAKLREGRYYNCSRIEENRNL